MAFIGGFAAYFFDPLLWLLALFGAFITKRFGNVERIFLIGVPLGFFHSLLIYDLDAIKQLYIASSTALVVFISINLIKLKVLDKDILVLTNYLGENLHDQIMNALKKDEILAGKNLTQLNATGYIFGYIDYFIEKDDLYKSSRDQIFSTVLNGVLPKRLEEIFVRNYEKYNLALGVDELSHEVDNFVAGVKWGRYDAEKSSDYIQPQSLEAILLGEKPKVKLD